MTPRSLLLPGTRSCDLVPLRRKKGPSCEERGFGSSWSFGSCVLVDPSVVDPRSDGVDPSKTKAMAMPTPPKSTKSTEVEAWAEKLKASGAPYRPWIQFEGYAWVAANQGWEEDMSHVARILIQTW